MKPIHMFRSKRSRILYIFLTVLSFSSVIVRFMKNKKIWFFADLDEWADWTAMILILIYVMTILVTGAIWARDMFRLRDKDQ